MTSNIIYLDNSATTKPHPDVLNSFLQASERFYANPSSIHQFGAEAEKLLMKAKKQVAELIGAAPDELIFTSGGTEGNNLAIKGIALKHQRKGKHIITTEIEHPSVYETCKSLEKQGFKVTYLPVDQNGVVSVKDLRNAIQKDTILISVMHVNNELGSIQPISEIGRIAKRYPDVYFHVDNVQGYGKVPLSLKQSGVDLCTFSGHKIHGLKGTGLLYTAKGTQLAPLFHGGQQEGAIRPGTENMAGIVAMAKAMRLIVERENEAGHLLHVLHSQLREGLKTIAEVKVNTPEYAAPHIMNFSIPGFKPEVIIHTLGEQGIYISTKSACSSKQQDESRIVAACGYGKERAGSALRVSLSYDNTADEINIFLKTLKKAIDQLKDVMR